MPLGATDDGIRAAAGFLLAVRPAQPVLVQLVREPSPGEAVTLTS